MGAVIQYPQRGNTDRNQRWERIERAERFERYGDRKAQGMSQRQAAQVRDYDTWQERMAQALAGLNCQVIQSTSDAAPGLLAYVEHHPGAHHSPDVFHVQHELSKAVSGPMATRQRAAHKAVAKAEETLKRVQESLDMVNDELAQRGPGRPPKGAARLEQVKQEVAAVNRTLGSSMCILRGKTP